MNKKAVIILIAVSAILVVIAVFTFNFKEKHSAFTVAVLLSVDDSADDSQSLFLFNALEDGHGSDLFYANISSDVKFVDKSESTITMTNIEPGLLIELTYSGFAQYIYPAIYTDIKKVKVLGQASDDLYALALERQTEWNNKTNLWPR